ncbi:sensor domain-containing diguanylate cyclase [Magnetospira thiophila]
MILTALVYYLLAQMAIRLTIMPEGIASFWPPNAVIIAALILSPTRRWPLFVAAGIASEFLADIGHFPLWQIFGFAMVNAGEALFSSALIRFVVLKGKPFQGLTVNLSLALAVIFLFMATPLAALGGAALYYIGDDTLSYWEFWRVWWFGDAIGLLLITPLLLTWLTQDRQSLFHFRAPLSEFLVAATAILVLSGIVFLSPASWPQWTNTPSLVLPLLAWVALRFGPREAATALVGVAFIAAAGTTNGLGAFAGAGTQAHIVILLQEFLLTAAALSVLLGTAFRQLSLAHSDLRQERNLLEERVKERTRELHDAKQSAEILSRTDGLTKLNNRRAFMDECDEVNSRALRYGHPYSFIMIDLDFFKTVNDNHGHAMGDAALKIVATIIKESIRNLDIAGRLGGEEFAICLPDTSSDAAEILAERLRKTIANTPVTAQGKETSLTASLGVSTFQAEDKEFETVLNRADSALYKAKDSGRNAVVVA